MWLVVGSVMAFVVGAACGDEVTVFEPAGTSSNNTGGNGGGQSVGGSTSNGGSPNTGGGGSSSVGGSPPTGNICDQACAKIENECGIAGACALIGLDCTDPTTECPGQCLLDADCAAILSLAGGTPDPTLGACVQTCQGGMGGGPQQDCFNCVIGACGSELQACQNDMVCQQFGQCVQGCADSTCAQNCQSMYPGMVTDDLFNCTCTGCANDCAICP
jgi:hypothetical protein